MQYLESFATLPERLRRLRLAAGLTQAELSALCGWPKTNARIGNYESGSREPSTDDMRLIARALRIHPAVLHYGAEALLSAPLRIPYFTSLAEIRDKRTERMVEIVWPSNLSEKAFALRVPDNRHLGFRRGEIIIIDPKVSPSTNDFVVLRAAGDPASFVIARCDRNINACQFNQMNKQSTAISPVDAATRFIGVIITSIISRRS